MTSAKLKTIGSIVRSGAETLIIMPSMSRSRRRQIAEDGKYVVATGGNVWKGPYLQEGDGDGYFEEPVSHLNPQRETASGTSCLVDENYMFSCRFYLLVPSSWSSVGISSQEIEPAETWNILSFKPILRDSVQLALSETENAKAIWWCQAYKSSLVQTSFTSQLLRSVTKTSRSPQHIVICSDFTLLISVTSIEIG